MRSIGVAALLIVVATLSAATGAQEAKPSPDVEIPDPAYVTLMIARDPGVHSELKLTPKQMEMVGSVVANIDTQMWQLRDVPPVDCRAKLDANLETLRTGLVAALNDDQLARFDQIVMQARGVKALCAPDVRRDLGLNDQQVAQIKQVIADAKQGPLDQKRLLGYLTPEQQQKVASLFGAGFDMQKLRRIASHAPDLTGEMQWINSKPLTLKQLEGKVVVVHFWAFQCINCQRNLPHYQKWFDTFSSDDLTIVGIQTPELIDERDPKLLEQAIIEHGIKYPVVLDVNADNWKAWATNMWPSVYIIDRQGNVRAWWYGELNWEGATGEETLRNKIAELIAEH